MVGDDVGAGFDEFLFGFGEGVGEVAVDIELGGKLLVRKNGNNDFRLHDRGSREIARIGGDILDNYDLSGSGRRAAESVAEGDASFGSEAAGERPDDQEGEVRGIHEIKTGPVVAGHLLVQAVGDLLHYG